MSTTQFSVYKVTSLPTQLQPNSLYFVSVSGNAALMEVYVTDNAGTAARHVVNSSEIQTMINNSLSAFHELIIVNDITARNALLPLTSIKYVYVKDATGDSTVKSGGATYLYDVSGSAWVKISEAESLDVVFNWSSLSGGPSSTPSQIDSAVAASHSHGNKSYLDKVGEDSNGNLLYNNNLPHIGWDSANW
jgi:hypothetical protein